MTAHVKFHRVLVVHDMWVLKHIAPWDILWSEDIETFLVKTFKPFSIKFIHKDIIQNLNKCWAQNVSISQEAECFDTPILYTADTHFYNSSVKIGFIYLCSSSDTQKFHHLLECDDIGINSSLIFF